MQQQSSRYVGVATTATPSRGLQMALGLVLIALTWLAAGMVRADETIIRSHGYSNFGDLKYAADFEHLEYVNPDAPKGGEISTWSQGTFDSFNQYARDGVSAALNTIGVEALMTSTADDPYGIYCYLCTTIEYPEDLKWVIFNLRTDVAFSDGRPMTAEDIAFSHQILLEQGITEYRAIIEEFYDGVEVLDPYRVKFNFKDTAPIRERIGFAGGTPAFSKSWFEETGTRLDKSTNRPFLATGAYVLDTFDFNRFVQYRRNPDYWGNDIPFNIGRNNFDSIRVEYFADGSAAFEGFKSGEYTFRTENSSLQWATGYDFPGVKSGHVIVAELPDGSVGTAQGFIFNLERPKWQDQRVRDALGMVFNFEWSNASLFYGLYSRVDSFWPGTDLAASGLPSAGEAELLKPLVDEGLLPASILTDEALLPPTNDADRNTPARSVFRKAAALLDEAGWIVGDDGIRMRDGERLTADFLMYSPQFDRIVNPYIANLKALGVDAKLDRVDTAQYVERTRSGDFDLVNHSFDMGFEPGLGLEQWFASKTAADSSRNLMRLRNDAVDKLIPYVVAAKTLEDLNTSVHALDRVLRSIQFTVPQWFKNVHTVAYYDMYRHPEALPPLSLGNLDFWWYDAEAAEALKAAGALR